MVKKLTCNHSQASISLDESAKRYGFSKYVIDPNKFRFQKVIRILSVVYKLIENCKAKVKNNSLIVSITILENEIKRAMDYFFRKATLEIKCFQKVKAYEKVSIEKNNILYYSGRILPTQSVSSVAKISDVMMDLCEHHFVFP